MSDQTSIFKESTEVTPQQSQTETSNVQTEAPEDLLKLIKNERGEAKYKDVPTALRALQASQEHIPQLTAKQKELAAELEQARAEAAKVAELERIVASLTQREESQSTPAQKTLSAEDIAQTVTSILNKKEAEKTAAANINATVSVVAQVFGSKAEDEFYGRAAALGMSKEEINNFAARNPKATLQMLGIEAKKANEHSSSNKEQVNTEGFKQNPNSFIGRSKSSILVGAETNDLKQAVEDANKMVEEVEAAGMTMKDLENPKNFFKYFK